MKRILLSLLLCAASVRAGDIFIFNSGASTALPAALTNGAALGATALQPSWAATGHVATAGHADVAGRAASADLATDATYAIDAGRAATADFATEADNANFAAAAMLADNANFADAAHFATEAATAMQADNANFADIANSATEARFAESLMEGMDDAIALAAATAHITSPDAHPDIRALIPALPGPGCTELTYAADGTNVTITGATYSYFFAPDKAYTLSVAPDAPRYHYSIEIIGDHACTLPAGHRLRGAWTITGTNEVVIAPSTGTVWNVFGRGL